LIHPYTILIGIFEECVLSGSNVDVEHTFFAARMSITPELAFRKQSLDLCFWTHLGLRPRKCLSAALGSIR
jgi:hypothetical protein